MGIPVVKMTKLDGNTGVVKPGSKGICAIIAPSSIGTVNQPTSETKANQVVTDFGYGALSDFAAYILSVCGNPVVCIKANASTAGVYSAVTFTGTGTAVITAHAATAPYDDFSVLVNIINGGTQGVTGITYTYSLDNGQTTSAVQALGTAVTFTIPNSNVQFDIATGSLVAGDKWTCTTTGPRLNTTDLSNALEALRTSQLPWEIVLVAGHDSTSTTVSTLDTWLSAREAEGRFRGFVCNARPKNVGESEAAYLTAMTTAWNATASIRGCVCVDTADVASVLPGRGIVQARYAAMFLAARLMKIPFGRDASYVADGPVPGAILADSRGNPNHHDENLFPGPDAIRLVSLRTFERKNGVYITNPNVISSGGSDYVFAQHFRTMNRACEIVYDILTTQLSRGVHKNPKTGPNGEVYIAEEDAQLIEGLCNASLSELIGQVSDLRFVLSRTDNIGAAGPVTLNGEIQVQPLAYAKEFDINSRFVRTISVQN